MKTRNDYMAEDSKKEKIVRKPRLFTKQCEWCGLDFQASKKSQRFCKREHYADCVVCGKHFLVKNPARAPKTCSPSCTVKLGHTEASKQKRIENSRKKYGTDYPSQDAGVKAKIKRAQDNSEHDTRIGSKAYKEMIKAKYGDVDNVSQVDSVKEKKKQTLQKHYGVDNPMRSKDILKEREKRSIAKYGSQGYQKAIAEALKAGDTKRIENWNNFKAFVENLPEEKTIKELAEYFQISTANISLKLTNENVNRKMIKSNSSNKEAEFERYIHDNLPNVNMRVHDRTVLNPQELDFYFPDQKLAVEISPTRTHNTLSVWDREGKTSKYHQDKFKKCSELGIELITIFDWHDWDKIIEMIATKLTSVNQAIYARNTEYRESKKLNKDIFEKLLSWHILSLPQNYNRNSDVGTLEYNGDIVGIALWAPTKDKDTIELKRMVFKPGVSVSGGASKLLKNYLKNHQYNKVLTYSDNDLGNGRVYQTIGFNLTETSRPNVHYYNPLYHWHIKGYSLVIQGADRLLKGFPKYEPVGIGENLPSNQEIVISYGFLPVYDCGYNKWEYSV